MKPAYISLLSLLLSLLMTSCQAKGYSYFSAIEDNQEALFMRVYADSQNKEGEKLRRKKVDEIKEMYIANLIKYFQQHPKHTKSVQQFLESYNKLVDTEEKRRETGIKPDPKEFLQWMATH